LLSALSQPRKPQTIRVHAPSAAYRTSRAALKHSWAPFGSQPCYLCRPAAPLLRLPTRRFGSVALEPFGSGLIRSLRTAEWQLTNL
jgi:hypothetical protein